ncbi:hypothetical protein [Turicibacter sanguinis]|uniref:Uncharacterized protein n=2 Tax=Turicibacter sanguinis TaxID=154288 RepID=A0A6G2CD64_9FIRM|nr:hypothetical protein [Turicibacter sanguinis]EFF65125.1 conserved hypothetical protein [Turicibacter sanguinis PC909]MTK22613.1 hypothetical protein [Turicibacter sanguinis]MTK70467.1 hypothetical protein [Turicibacter sanguinis]MTK73805.1 hypothetical protein [Turicibacter sanguinis]MTK81350.1 hypothetical protein [Turicibacter sanguinis]
MLEVVKNITLNGVSKIDGQPVAYMNASLSTDANGSNNVNTNIANRELYNANKEQVRQDIADFDEMVYVQEDELVGGQI